ncbi:MAG: hypothetical protein V4709_13295 [Pseudomonadota bacterium]
MSKQLLSAAVDAAATEAEWIALIDAVGEAPELKAEWSRIWASRDAREGVVLKASPDFSAGVMAAIAAEKSLPSNVVSLRRKAEPALARRSLNWRTLVPLSAAAGVVAAVMVVGGMRQLSSDEAVPLITSNASQLATTPVNVASNEGAAELPDAAKAAILNAYLMEHSNSLAERSMGGTLANARFAARTADYRPDAP